jgi:hypothetical protein
MKSMKKKIKKGRYEKPELKIIELKAEEVLVGGCKLSSGGMAVGSVATCIANSCSGAGS